MNSILDIYIDSKAISRSMHTHLIIRQLAMWKSHSVYEIMDMGNGTDMSIVIVDYLSKAEARIRIDDLR